MKRIKLFVGKSNIIKLRCPNCLENKQIPASVLKSKYKFTAKCKCQTVFEVELEYRRSIRKETNLDGYYSYSLKKLQNHKVLEGDIVTGFTSTNCNIMDISTYGLKFNCLFPHEIKNDDLLYIIFKLSSGTNIEKKVVVRNVRGGYIGCEFIDVQEGDQDIGLYLL